MGLEYKLLELNQITEVVTKFHLKDTHNLILGRDILHKLGIILNFENITITW